MRVLRIEAQARKHFRQTDGISCEGRAVGFRRPLALIPASPRGRRSKADTSQLGIKKAFCACGTSASSYYCCSKTPLDPRKARAKIRAESGRKAPGYFSFSFREKAGMRVLRIGAQARQRLRQSDGISCEGRAVGFRRPLALIPAFSQGEKEQSGHQPVWHQKGLLRIQNGHS